MAATANDSEAPPAAAASRGVVLETARLLLRCLSDGDAPFMLELLNDPGFIANIGDKGVRTEVDAARYIEQTPVASYARFGYGMWAVELRHSGCPVGICGLVKRDALPDPDLGFAFLARHRSRGYAHESAAAVMGHARRALGLKRLLAVVVAGNTASRRLLDRLGFGYFETRRLSDTDPELLVYASAPLSNRQAEGESDTTGNELETSQNRPPVVAIRPAAAADVPLIHTLIRELAEYERLRHEVVATEERLRETLFGEPRRAEVLIAALDDEPVGFALFFHNYSTFLGRPGIYLEDLYVREHARGRGIGRRLLASLARIARERGCERLEWWVLDWNEPAIRFYKSLGAQPMSGFTVYRATGEALARLADGGG